MAKDTKLAALGPALRLPAARMVALNKMPYFGSGIEDLVPFPMEGSGKVGVTEGGMLCFDPEVFGQWTALEAGTVVIHEYLHLFLRHAARFTELCRRGVAQATPEDHNVFNQAADAEINDDLQAAGLPLPAINGCPPVTPRALGFKENLTAEQYFMLLKEKAQEQQQQPPNGSGKAQPPKAPSSPGCGSGAGNPQAWEPDAPAKSKLERDGVSQELTRKVCAEKVLERQKARGDVPAGILAQAEGLIPKSTIAWEDQLRSSVFASCAFISGEGEYTFTVPNRMQSILEDLYGDDAPVLPGEHQPLPRVLTVFDTSGSVSDDDLLSMVGHTMGILDCLGGMACTFMACDAEVHAVAEVKTPQDIFKHMKGRGGTDFRPAFEAVKKLREQPDVLIFMTDMYGPAPETAPRGYKTIWLVTPGGAKPPWGDSIYMSPEDAARHGH